MSRKTKGSNNRYKAQVKVAKIHAQIKDARTDCLGARSLGEETSPGSHRFLHKLTTKLVRDNSLIALEDLAVRNLVRKRCDPALCGAVSFRAAKDARAGRGLQEQALSTGESKPTNRKVPSRRAPRHHKLARSISDASWGEMFRQLEYKCEWYGRKLVKVDRFFPSSKRCNHCGFVIDKLPLDIRSWDCPRCETKGIDRDINAGQNILAAGLAVIVCGADIRPNNQSVKGQLRKTQGRDFRGCLENSSRPPRGKKQKPK